MEMHQLRYAVAIARTGNFSRAAEQCHVSQPSLSQQILKLEEELGERLFDRTKREARPTSHGEIFLRRAIRVLEEVDAARREAADAKQMLTGTVNIGVIPTIAPYLIPGVTAAFLERFPGIEVIVHEEPTSRLLKLLRGYEVDLAILSTPIERERLEIRNILTDELLIALPPKHPLVQKKTLQPADLENERLIVMQEGHCLGDQVLGFCARGNMKPRISFRSAQLETLQSMVHAGMGISLVPSMAIRHQHAETPVYRTLSGKSPSRNIIAAWPSQRPLGRAVTEYLARLQNSVKKAEQRKSKA